MAEVPVPVQASYREPLLKEHRLLDDISHPTEPQMKQLEIVRDQLRANTLGLVEDARAEGLKRVDFFIDDGLGQTIFLDPRAGRAAVTGIEDWQRVSNFPHSDTTTEVRRRSSFAYDQEGRLELWIREHGSENRGSLARYMVYGQANIEGLGKVVTMLVVPYIGSLRQQKWTYNLERLVQFSFAPDPSAELIHSFSTEDDGLSLAHEPIVKPPYYSISCKVELDGRTLVCLPTHYSFRDENGERYKSGKKQSLYYPPVSALPELTLPETPVGRLTNPNILVPQTP